MGILSVACVSFSEALALKAIAYGYTKCDFYLLKMHSYINECQIFKEVKKLFEN